MKRPTVKKVVCGSTNLSWRGFFVQSNNAFVLTGQTAVDLFFAAFDNYFGDAKNSVAGIAAKPSRLERPRLARHRRQGSVFAPQHGQRQVRRIATDINEHYVVAALLAGVPIQVARSCARRNQGLTADNKISSTASLTRRSAISSSRTRAATLRRSMRRSSARMRRHPSSQRRAAAGARGCTTSSS